MKRKLKHLGMLALAMGIITGSNLMYGNKTEVQAGGGGAAFISQVDNPILSDIDTTKFENATDIMYYNAFGENFKIIQEYSEQVNKTVDNHGLRMEVLSTITIKDNIPSSYTSYTFFTLQDVTSNNRINSTSYLNLGYEIGEDIPMAWGQANPISFNEETQTMTFLAKYNHSDIEADSYLEHVPIKIENVIGDFTNDTILLDNLDIMDLISNHNPNFTNNKKLGASYSIQQQNLDIDFEELLDGDTLIKDELSIPIDGWDSAYISNIALVDNMIHIQTNTTEINSNIGQWHNIELIDDKTDNVISFLYSISLDNKDEDFNNIDDRVYEEFVFLIDDTDNISNYNISLDRYYYDTIIDTNLEISFSSPVIKNSYKTGEETQILIDNEKVKVSNINVSLMGLNFDIEGIEVLEEKYNDVLGDIGNTIDVTLIYNNGVEQIYSNKDFIIYWNYEEDGTSIRDISIDLSGAVIDVDNLEAININGTVIEVN